MAKKNKNKGANQQFNAEFAEEVGVKNAANRNAKNAAQPANE